MAPANPAMSGGDALDRSFPVAADPTRLGVHDDVGRRPDPDPFSVRAGEAQPATQAGSPPCFPQPAHDRRRQLVLVDVRRGPALMRADGGRSSSG